MNVFTEKQKKLLRALKERKLKRINILHGSVRRGKTWISLVLWSFWVLASPEDKNYLMAAKTLTALKRNCLDLLEELIGKNNFSYSLAQKEGQLFGRKIYLEGVNDARAESKIRGMTLQGAYCDELTLFNEDFFSMLSSRLSEARAKLFGTTKCSRFPSVPPAGATTVPWNPRWACCSSHSSSTRTGSRTWTFGRPHGNTTRTSSV